METVRNFILGGSKITADGDCNCEIKRHWLLGRKAITNLPGSSVHGFFPGKNTGVGCHFLLQGIFLTQGSNPDLQHCKQMLYHLSHQGSHNQPRMHIKQQRRYFANKGPSSQSHGFSSGHVWMWELDHKESWAPKKRCCWAVVLEKTLESPLDCKEIQSDHPKGDQSWIIIRRTDAEAETPVLWPSDAKSWLIGKDPDAGKDWRQEEKGTTEDEMVGWHYWLSGHEFE